jgi:hypothetical protein
MASNHQPEAPSTARREFLQRVIRGGAAVAFGAAALPSSVQGIARIGGRRYPGTLGMEESQQLAAPRPTDQEIELFNGRDLDGWDAYLVEEGVAKDDVWSVHDGILVCKGNPNGYLYTRDDFQDFHLVVEWRWPEEPGNSGVLMRVAVEEAMLPSCIEAQLRSGSAGDMYGFQGFRIGGDPERLSEISIGWALGRIEGNENEPGQWNRYEITADGGRIVVVLNGKMVNEATDCEVRPGRIGLQSEGGIVHFRKVALTPM